MTSRLAWVEEELYAAASARPRDAARYAAALERAVQACRTDPAAAARRRAATAGGGVLAQRRAGSVTAGGLGG